MNLKLSALVLATAGAFASTAFASGTQIYGVIDQGLDYQHVKTVGGSKTDSLSMVSGQYIGSRFGLKSEERFDNGTTVGVQLEGGLSTDSGMSGQSGRLFGRDARLYVDNQYGLFSAGRMGAMVGGNGPYARFGHILSPFSCGWGNVGGHLQVMALGYEYVDNALAWASPKFAGFDATLQYSNGTDVKNFGTGVEGKSSVERMYAGALRYTNNNFMMVGGIERINFAQPAASEAGLKDAISYNLGGSYQAGWAKFYAYGQYFQNYTAAARTTTFALPSGVDGWGANVGVDVPVSHGFIKAGLGYGDFKGSKDSDRTMKTWQAAVGYLLPLSKRTSLYTAANYINSRYSDAQEAANPKAGKQVIDVIAGLMHKF